MKRFYAVALVAGGIFLGACVAPQVGVKPSEADTGTTVTWEYKFNTDPGPASHIYNESDANTLGKDRWEMVGIAYLGNNNYRYVYKRPVSN